MPAATLANSATPSAPATRFSRPRFAFLVLVGVYPLITALLYAVLPLTDGWPLWQRTLLIAEAQSDETASQALATYSSDRRKQSGQIIERARERGEVRSDVDPIVVADLLAAYAWAHLLTNRLDESDETIRAAVGHIANGIKHRPNE